MSAVTEADVFEHEAEIATLKHQRDELLTALKAVLQIDVKGHQLQDRLQFSPAGRAILEQALAAIAKVTGGAA